VGAGVGAARFAFRLRAFYEVNGDLLVAGVRRRYLLRVPETYDPGRPSPLVVVIHGFMQSPSHQCTMSRWDELAASQGFLTVYPLGTGVPPHWDPHGTVRDGAGPHRAGPRGRGPDQVGYIEALIDEVAGRYPIDSDRVYASGMSNGGGLASRLALELPGTFAAVGSVSGLYSTSPGEPTSARTVPLIAFHGALDRIIPIEGGTRRLGYPLPPVAAWMASYARHCGCTVRTETAISEDITRVRYTGGPNGAEVVWYRIADAGHTWPGGVPLPEVITGPTSAAIDATRLTWEFFCDHPLAAVAPLRPGSSTPQG